MATLPTEFYEQVGYCIYCGAVEPDVSLSDEHIMPYALGGHRVLPKASCQLCATVTGSLEGIACGKMWREARARLGLPTRRKKSRPTEVIVEARVGGTRKMPLGDLPALILLPIYPPPGSLVGRVPERGIGFLGANLCGFGLTEEAATKIAGGGQSADLFPNHFARFLAKLAHGIAFAEFRDKQVQYLLPDIILGKSEFLGHLVGGAPRAIPYEGRGLHGTRILREQSFACVAIRLFMAHDLSPTYLVVAARLQD